VLDPLGHALNADAGVSVGTIFGVYLTRSHDDAASSSHVLRRGSELCAAGYALYGASTQLVLSRGHGVDGFTLHPVLESFTLTRPRLQMPLVGKIFSVNLGHMHEWTHEVCTHIDNMSQRKSLRYIGTFVADVHRTLLYGGIFFYPPSRKRRAGKLRLLYEVAPIAFLMEQAGGGCTTGKERVLDVLPTSLHQRVPVAFGSMLDVQAYSSSVANAASSPSPMHSPPSSGSPEATRHHRRGLLGFSL